jgi:hypothetical protein
MNGLRKCGIYTQMEFYAAMKKNEMLSFAGKWMELENIILSEVSLAQKTKNRMFSLICGHYDKARAHKGGMRIGKTPKKLDSICCPLKQIPLKQLRPTGEGDHELEERLVREELT